VIVNRQLFLKAGTTGELVGQIVARQLAPIGIPGSLLAVLTHVRDREPVTPSTISSLAGIPLTTLRDNVQRLVERGLVRRTSNPSDGRSYLLVLTPAGRRLVEEAGVALLAAYVALEAHLDQPLADVERQLDRLNDALTVALDDLLSSPARGGLAAPVELPS